MQALTRTDFEYFADVVEQRRLFLKKLGIDNQAKVTKGLMDPTADNPLAHVDVMQVMNTVQEVIANIHLTAVHNSLVSAQRWDQDKFMGGFSLNGVEYDYTGRKYI